MADFNVKKTLSRPGPQRLEAPKTGLAAKAGGVVGAKPVKVERDGVERSAREAALNQAAAPKPEGTVPVMSRPSVFETKQHVPFAFVDVRPGASRVLGGRTFDAVEADALERAHLVGMGEVGKDGVNAAQVGNFTWSQLRAKVEILQKSFGRDEIRTLMREGIMGGTNADAAHYAIATDLYNGRVAWSAPFNANNNNTSLYKVSIENPATGRSREGLFKPRAFGDNDGWGRTPMEYVTYALNRMLGMDYVPPVAYRRNLEVGGQQHAEGSVQYMVPDAKLLKYSNESEWGTSKELLLSDTRILDVLIQNSDRHAGNFLIGAHWVDGKPRAMLIDHAAGLRPGAYVTLEHDNAFGTGPVQVIRKSTFDALKGLQFDSMKRQLGEFISDDEIRGMLAQRDGIVKTMDALIAKNGLANVVKE